MATQQPEDRSGGEEGIGDGAAVVDGEGHAKVTVHLGHQQRMRRNGSRTVELSQPAERQVVVGVSGSDGYGGRCHVVEDRLRKWV